MSLIVTGSISIDHVESPMGAATDMLGGSTIYFSAAASFFTPVRLVGAVGEDFPADFEETFKRFNVDLAGFERRKGSKSFRWHGRYHEDMNNRDTLDVQLNVLAEAPPAVPDAFRDSRYIFLACTAPQIQLDLLNQFPDREIVVADTIDLYIKTEKPGVEEVIRRVDGVIINDEEAKMLTGESGTLKAADQILAMGPTFVVVKKGEHGAILRHAEGDVVLPAYPTRQVVDPTGAGDSFAGGMMGHLAATGDLGLASLRRALAYGTIAASYTVEAFTIDRLMQISRGDIDQRFEAYRAMLHIGG